MKLHLHWLRFDLHRFRVLLGVWTLLVAAYAVFLGWVHLRFLTLSPEILDRSLYVAVLLGLVELCFLFALFNADPAKGPRHFWRTRPPSGVAVAGSKLVLALAFFVALPLLAWGAVNAFCVLPEYAVTLSPTGLSWTAFLFWIQSLTVSAFAMAAARASGKMAFHLRLIFPFIILLVIAWALPMIWLWTVRPLDQEIPVPRLLPRWLGHGFITLPMAVLTLTGVSLYLLLARRRRLPRGQGFAALTLLPASALFIAAAIFTASGRRQGQPRFRDEFPPPLDPAAAASIRVLETPLRSGSFEEVPFLTSLEFPEDWFCLFQPPPTPPAPVRFSASLRVEGLPPGVQVRARWLNLSLTAPDGTVVQGDTRGDAIQSEEIPRSDPNYLPTLPVNFPKRELDVLSPVPRTGSGTLRLTLYALKNQLLPPPDGQQRSGPWGPLIMRRTREDVLNPNGGAEWINLPRAPKNTALAPVPDSIWFFDFRLLNSTHPPIDVLSDYSSASFEAVKGRDNIPIKMAMSRSRLPTGFLIRHELLSGAAFLQSRKDYFTKEPEPDREVFQDWDLLKAVYTGRALPDGWQLRIGSTEPYATVDLTVTLHDLVPGTGRGRTPALLKALSGIHVRENDSLEQVRSALRHAYGLISAMPQFTQERSSSEEWRRAVSLWRGILDETSHTHLPVLLGMIQDEHNRPPGFDPPGIIIPGYPPAPDDIEYPASVFYFLSKRTAALLQPADILNIPPDSRAAEELRPFLPASAWPDSATVPEPAPASGGQGP